MNSTLPDDSDMHPTEAPSLPVMALTPVNPDVPALAAQAAPSGAITAAQAKIDAVASLTFKAYERASTLQLTPEELTALQEQFPDEAFRKGAAGKDNLIYIEHASLRDRLNRVIGIGQWAIIPRSRWAEDYKTEKGGVATRVYVEAMFLVRGAFVSEAIGDMTYYPNNPSGNYGDAVEGAKSAALRRCVKDFGVGLQAWSKDWCEGWWRRNPRGQVDSRTPQDAPRAAERPKTPMAATKPHQQPPAHAAPPQGKPAAPKPTAMDQQAKWVGLCTQAGGGSASYATELFIEMGVLLPTEDLSDFPTSKMPTTKLTADNLLAEIRARAGVGDPDPPAAAAPAQSGPDAPDAPWRSFPMPWGKQAGTKLADLEKNYLYGLVMNYKVETEWQGKPRSESKIAADRQFRAMLDEAGKRYNFRAKTEASPSDDAHREIKEDDDVPF